jgi:ketosteroid isomerase-like protein
MLRRIEGSRLWSCAAALLMLSIHPVHASAQGRDSTVADTVRALESARAKALLSADTTALSRMTAAEFIEISRFAQLRTRADNIREIGEGTLKLTSVKYDSLTVQVYGDVAVLRGIADNTGTFRGMPFAGKLRYTRVFVRREGRWQAVAMQHTMMP